MKAPSRSWKGQGSILPEPPEGCSPAHPFCTSALQNCTVINVCCFKSLCLWQRAITAAIGNEYPNPFQVPKGRLPSSLEGASPLPHCPELPSPFGRCSCCPFCLT